jgi:hypothetical protein
LTEQNAQVVGAAGIAIVRVRVKLTKSCGEKVSGRAVGATMEEEDTVTVKEVMGKVEVTARDQASVFSCSLQPPC